MILTTLPSNGHAILSRCLYCLSRRPPLREGVTRALCDVGPPRDILLTAIVSAATPHPPHLSPPSSPSSPSFAGLKALQAHRLIGTHPPPTLPLFTLLDRPTPSFLLPARLLQHSLPYIHSVIRPLLFIRIVFHPTIFLSIKSTQDSSSPPAFHFASFFSARTGVSPLEKDALLWPHILFGTRHTSQRRHLPTLLCP